MTAFIKKFEHRFTRSLEFDILPPPTNAVSHFMCELLITQEVAFDQKNFLLVFIIVKII
jgi:hypothetical protein